MFLAHLDLRSIWGITSMIVCVLFTFQSFQYKLQDQMKPYLAEVLHRWSSCLYYCFSTWKFDNQHVCLSQLCFLIGQKIKSLLLRNHISCMWLKCKKIEIFLTTSWTKFASFNILFTYLTCVFRPDTNVVIYVSHSCTLTTEK